MNESARSSRFTEGVKKRKKKNESCECSIQPFKQENDAWFGDMIPSSV
jgi:hypothetical protein